MMRKATRALAVIEEICDIELHTGEYIKCKYMYMSEKGFLGPTKIYACAPALTWGLRGLCSVWSSSEPWRCLEMTCTEPWMASRRHFRRRMRQAFGRMPSETATALFDGSQDPSAPMTTGSVGPRLPYFSTFLS